MPGLTDDPNVPHASGGPDEEPVPQAETYLVLSDEELAKGYVRPLRHAYMHDTCGVVTTMASRLAATYARDNTFYGNTYCVSCSKHRPVSEFRWLDDETGEVTEDRVGS